MKNFTPKLFIVVGNPASGKDELIAAVNTIGALHADIVPKHTSRKWRLGDDDEMICAQIPDPENGNSFIQNTKYDFDSCDIKYTNYGTKYGIKTQPIWEGLRKGNAQVVVVSNKDTLNELKRIFGKLAVVIYVYSQISKDEYEKREREKNPSSENYTKMRVADFEMAWKIYEDNAMLFNHVFIYADKQEDLFDQIFRLFRAYEKGAIK